MKYPFLICAVFAFLAIDAKAQYAPQTPLPGNAAISQMDSRLVDWVSGCTVQRGWLDIADPSLGHPTLGTESDVIGFPSGGVLSLGDSGIAVLTFNYNIFNGIGPDFAVFENGFANPENDTLAYLELAFVEVSSDGVHYFRFPASSTMQDTAQIDNFSYSDASKYNNLAGKYISGYGTPFDLEELKNTVGLDINHISHIRLIDVVGSINPLYGSKDKDGHIINEAYPSPYPSAGFDLKGVGVINSLKPTAIKDFNNDLVVKIYPNPTNNEVHISTESLNDVHYLLSDLTGKEISKGTFSKQMTLSLKDKNAGYYLLQLENGKEHFTQKIIKH